MVIVPLAQDQTTQTVSPAQIRLNPCIMDYVNARMHLIIGISQEHQIVEVVAPQTTTKMRLLLVVFFRQLAQLQRDSVVLPMVIVLKLVLTPITLQIKLCYVQLTAGEIVFLNTSMMEHKEHVKTHVPMDI